MKWWTYLGVLALAVLLLDLAWLGRLERGGVPHVRIDLAGEVPATLYVPRPASGEIPPFGLPEPPPPGERPPVVVVVHGFSEDRAMMSPFARSLAEAGYAALAIDVRGHGENRNGLARGMGSDAALVADVGEAVDFLRTSPYVDGSRIALAGHSMGAGAILSYGGRDSGIDGVLLISGGWRLAGPHDPPNVLFLYAEGDFGPMKARLATLAGKLAGGQVLAPGVTVGEPAKGTGVRLVEIADTDHVGIIFSDDTIAECVAWLDAIYGTPRDVPARLVDARMGAVLVGLLAFLVLLPGLGVVIGRFAPHVIKASGSRVFQRLGLFFAALVLTLPLVAVEGTAEFLPLAIADSVLLHFAYAGSAVLAWLALSGGLALVAKTGRTGLAVAAAALGFAVFYALLAPLGAASHRMALTPERTLVAFFAALLLFPFCLASGLLLRRGSTWVATLTSLGGHVIVVAVLVIGVLVQIMPGILFLMIPIFAVLLLAFEIVATGIYAASRNITTIALLESLFIAWVFSAVMPILA